MNERIKQLAEQAGLKVESWMTNSPKPFQILGSTEQFEKFAELIVADIIDKIESVGFKSSNDIPFEITDLFVRQIKQHFGVKS